MTASVQTGGRDRELCCTTAWSASDDGVNRKNKFSHQSLSLGYGRALRLLLSRLSLSRIANQMRVSFDKTSFFIASSPLSCGRVLQQLRGWLSARLQMAVSPSPGELTIPP